MKTLAKSLLVLALLSLCACKGNNQGDNNTDSTMIAPPAAPANSGDTPYAPDSVRNDSAIRQADTAK